MKEVKPPKGEEIWVSYHKADGTTVAILTSKPTRDFYFLYEVKPDNTLNKLGKSKSPTELEEKFNVRTKMMKGA